MHQFFGKSLHKIKINSLSWAHLTMYKKDLGKVIHQQTYLLDMMEDTIVLPIVLV